MVLVREYPDHPTTSWIPKHYWEKLHILPDDADRLAFEPDPRKPLVVVDHGTFDMTRYCNIKHRMYSELYGDYYCSSTKNGHENLTRLGKYSYYTGSAFADFTRPSSRSPRLLVYAPAHAIPHPLHEGEMYCGTNDELLEEAQLTRLAAEYECEGYVTSAIAEDARLDRYTNVVLSDRHADLAGHHAKCRFLYENAKVIYEPQLGTFGITGAALGIPVIGVELTNETLNDGKCRARITAASDHIIKRERL